MWAALLALACAPKPTAHQGKLPPAPPPAATLVELATGSVSGADRDAVLRAVATAAVRPCFEAMIAKNASRYGEVVVRFTIAPAGTVSAAAAEFSTLGDDEAARCVAEAVKVVQFANRDTEITVLYPFLLLTERTPPEVARALRDRYGLLSDADREVSDDPRSPVPPGVIVVW